MQLTKKLVAFLLSFVLILSIVPTAVFAADEYDNVPQMIQSEGMYTVHSGVRNSSTLGSSASSDQSIGDYMVGDRSKCDLGAKTNFTEYDYIEFDIYVDNLVHLKSKVSQLNVYLQNSDGAKRVYWFYEDLLTKDGWNHIKLDLDEYDNIKGSNPRASVSSVRFRMLISTATSDYSTDRIRLANIAITKEISEINSVPAVSNVGEVIQQLYTDSGVSTYPSAFKEFRNTNRTRGTLGTTYDLSEATSFELDFYVDDLAKFEALAEEGQGLWLTVGSKQYTRRQWGQIDGFITKEGWNHIVIPRSLFFYRPDISESNADYTAINHFAIEFAYEVKENSITTASGEKYRFANLYATKADVEINLESLPYNPIVNVGKDQTEVYITWFTYNDKTGKLVFDGNEIAPFETGLSDDENLYYHRAKVTGLEANTTYEYSVGNEAFLVGPFTLKTNDFDNDFSFVQITDIQLPTNNKYLDNWKNTLSQINANLPETSFILNTGDISDACKTELYGYYKSPELLPGYVTTAVPGNHDNTPNSYFDEHFTTPETRMAYPGYGLNECDYWYSYNSILFIALNTNIRDNGYHKDTIRKAIQENEGKCNWIIVNCHHSLFSASYHKDESDVYSFRENLAPFYSEMGVDMVLSGHDHCYDRSYMMEGVYPQVSTESFSANTDGGVLYISAQSGSALKFNAPQIGYEEYSAEVVEAKYGFINYDVTDSAITLTYYSSADMTVLDSYTLYKDDGRHTVEPDSNLLKDRDLANVKLDSNGKYSVQLNVTEDITESCAVEIDLGLADDCDLTEITLALKDGNGNSLTKHFSGIKGGWNNLSVNLADMSGNADLTNIVALELTGTAGAQFAVANLYVGHTYSDDKDTTCEGCDNVREIFVDPLTVPEVNFKYEVLDSVEGSLHTIKSIAPGKNIYQNYAHYFKLPKTLNTVGGQYVEFDLYMSAENDQSFGFWVSSNRESGSPRGKYTIPAGLKVGWNHIVIDVTKTSGTSGSGYKFDGYALRHPYFEGTPFSSNHATGGDLKVANIAVTYDISTIPPTMSNVYDTLDSVEGNIHAINDIVPGKNIYQNYTHNFRLPKILETVGGQYIEFDLYVTADTDQTFSFWVSSNRESGNPRGRYTIPAGLKAGWNHIVFDVNKTSATSGSGYKFEGYEFDYPFFEHTPYSANHPTGGSIRIANLAVTYVKGDFTGDKEVDMLDVISCKKALLNSVAFKSVLDMNSDSVFDAVDLAILKKLLWVKF